MSDEEMDLRTQLRDANVKAKSTQAELRDARHQRTKWAIYSAIGGFLLFAVGGQWFPGYQLDSTARKESALAAEEAVKEVMAQLCAERFMQEAGLEGRLSELKKVDGDWNKTTYIREGSWAAAQDGKQLDYATAEKCRGLIATRVSADAGKAS